MKNIITSVLIVSGIALASGVQAASIDDFNGGWQEVEAPGANTVSYSDAIGGYRTIEIEKTSGSRSATADVLEAYKEFSHSADSGTSARSTITWNNNGNGLGGVDLAEGRVFSVFSFDILSIDQGNVDLTFSVWDTMNAMASYTLTGAGVGSQAVAFDNFMGIDFTSIDAISLIIEGGQASDIVLDNLRTVPTPATLILMLVGFAGFFFGRKPQVSPLIA